MTSKLTDVQIDWLFRQLEKIFGERWISAVNSPHINQDYMRDYWATYASSMVAVDIKTALRACKRFKDHRFKDRAPNVHEFVNLAKNPHPLAPKDPMPDWQAERQKEIYIPPNSAIVERELDKMRKICHESIEKNRKRG